MGTNELLQSMSEKLGADARVARVFGEPIQAGDRIVVPVAKVCYGFAGGGGGTSQEGTAEGGGAGYVRAVPAGVVEILPTGTRYVEFAPRLTWAALIAAGTTLGFFFARKYGRRT